jgi:hypothetical protein
VLGVTGGSNAASPLAAPYTYQFDAGVGEDAGNNNCDEKARV